MTQTLMTANRDMSERRANDADVQMVIRLINSASQEASLVERTKTWSGADFLYALDRLQTDRTGEGTEQLRELYRTLRMEREAEDARKATQEANAQRHADISHRLEQLKKPHWSIVPNFWMTLAILVFTVVGVIVAVLALYR